MSELSPVVKGCKEETGSILCRHAAVAVSGGLLGVKWKRQWVAPQRGKEERKERERKTREQRMVKGRKAEGKGEKESRKEGRKRERDR